MDISSKVKVQKNIRLDMEDWERIVEYAKSVNFPSENALLCDLLKKGIEAAEEEEIDDYIEEGNTKNPTFDPKKAMAELENPSGGTF